MVFCFVFVFLFFVCFFFLLCLFSFVKIHKPRDSRGKWRSFLARLYHCHPLHKNWDNSRAIRSQLCTQLVTGLKLGTHASREQVANHYATLPESYGATKRMWILKLKILTKTNYKNLSFFNETSTDIVNCFWQYFSNFQWLVFIWWKHSLKWVE